MVTFLFFIGLIWVLWKIIKFGIKATWGIFKLCCTVLLLPLILIALVIVGLMYVAMPILIIVGIITVIGGIVKR